MAEGTRTAGPEPNAEGKPDNPTPAPGEPVQDAVSAVAPAFREVRPPFPAAPTVRWVPGVARFQGGEGVPDWAGTSKAPRSHRVGHMAKRAWLWPRYSASEVLECLRRAIFGLILGPWPDRGDSLGGG